MIHLRAKTRISAPESVDIVEDDSGVFLLRLDSSGECIADTWHESIEAAKSQARFEYEIGEEDWKEVKIKAW